MKDKEVTAEFVSKLINASVELVKAGEEPAYFNWENIIKEYAEIRERKAFKAAKEQEWQYKSIQPNNEALGDYTKTMDFKYPSYESYKQDNPLK